MESNQEHVDPTVILTDGEGNEREMVIVYSFEMKKNHYAVLLDKNEPGEDGVLMKVEQDGDEAFLSNIEDDEEWENAVAAYEQIVKEEQTNQSDDS